MTFYHSNLKSLFAFVQIVVSLVTSTMCAAEMVITVVTPGRKERLSRQEMPEVFVSLKKLGRLAVHGSMPLSTKMAQSLLGTCLHTQDTSQRQTL